MGERLTPEVERERGKVTTWGKTENREQRTEDRGQMSAVRWQRSEVRRQRSEVRDHRSAIGSQRTASGPEGPTPRREVSRLHGLRRAKEVRTKTGARPEIYGQIPGAFRSKATTNHHRGEARLHDNRV